MMPVTNAGRTIVYPTTNQRANYNALAVMFGKNCVLFPGTLRSEVVLTATNSISFSITDTTAASVTEIRLNQNDSFVVEDIMIALTFQVTAESIASQVFHTFPNDKVFAAAALLAAKGFYNGKVLIQLNDIVYAKSLDMMNFMRADTAQAGTAVSSVATTGIQSNSAWEGDRAFKRLVPNIIFNGTSNNNVTVQLPDTLTFTTANSTVRAVLMCRGILVQNGGRMRSQ